MSAPAVRAWASTQAALCLLVLVCLNGAAGPAQAQGLQPLTIQTGAGPQTFEVEIADTDAERSQGLMYRKHLAADHGMLFDFKRVEPVGFWMKNTYIPLDMLFIRKDGRIARIAADTEPLSTRIIPSGEAILAVLEVPGGTARRLGIRDGDKVEFPLFAPH